MTASFPLRYAHANILLGRGGEAAGLYRLGMSAYPFLPIGEKWALARSGERFTQSVAADFSLWRVNRSYPAEQYVEHTQGLLDERHHDTEIWRSYLEGHQQRLRQLDSHFPEVYLAVPLARDRQGGLGRELVRSVDRVRRRIEELAGIGSPSPIPASELEALRGVEARIFDRVRGVLAARRAHAPSSFNGSCGAA